MAGDLYWDKKVLHLPFDSADDLVDDNTVLLLHMDGASGGTSFIDNSYSKKPITVAGNTNTSTAQQKFGATSAYFDGTGDYLSLADTADLKFGTGDFTVEAWVYVTATPSVQKAMIAGRQEYGTNSDWVFQVQSDLKVSVYFNSNTTTYVSVAALSLNTWTHIAMCRSGSSLVLFVGGTGTTHTFSGSTESTVSGVYTIGADQAGDEANLTGYIDDLRIVKGRALYTADFTAPAAPHANPSKSLDYSPSKKQVTVYGNASLNTTTKKFGASSMYFDGTGDYAQVATTNDLAFGTGDFTAELWFQTTSLATQNTLLEFRPADSNGAYIFLAVTSGGSLHYYVSTADRIVSANSAVTTGNWYHVAVCRSNGVTKLFLGGTSVGSWVDATNYLVGGVYGVRIGQSAFAAAPENLNGYIDDLVIYKGYAKYTSDFTPPTSAIPTGPAYLSGLVYDSTNTLTSRVVRAYNRTGGALIGSAVSDPTTGVWSIPATIGDSKATAYALDGTPNDPYYDKVQLRLPFESVTELADDNTVLLLNFNGANAATSTVDMATGKAVTFVGNAQLNTTTKKFGTASCYFDGTGDYLTLPNTADLRFATNAFTFECWVYVTNTPGGGVNNDMTVYGTLIGTGFLFFYLDNATRILSVWNGTTGVSTTSAVPLNTWTHLAVSRDTTSTLRLFIGGVVSATSSSYTYNNSNSTETIKIGGNAGNYGNRNFWGYIDGLRVTNGVCIYDADFTPPTSETVLFASRTDSQRSTGVVCRVCDGAPQDPVNEE